MILPPLPTRNLDRAELEPLVNELASLADSWTGLVTFSDEQRHFVSLYRDEFVDLWLLCWTETNDTGWHDHDISSGAVRVVEGVLCESSPRIGGDPATRTIRAGDSVSFGPDHIHRLCGVTKRAVSLHAYSPPLWRLGQYSIDANGVMRRASISYAEELRPVDAGLV
jgi:hypothetical protein